MPITGKSKSVKLYKLIKVLLADEVRGEIDEEKGN